MLTGMRIVVFKNTLKKQWLMDIFVVFQDNFMYSSVLEFPYREGHESARRRY